MTSVKTSILFLSDTHGQQLSAERILLQPVDVVVHSGDLTEGSKLDEFRNTLEFLKGIDAPLKLVIAGNHDFTLDVPAFKRKIAEAVPSLEPELVAKHYGTFGEARQMFEDGCGAGIVFLDEGHHSFTLENGAELNVYASPYTPSYGTWGFQYRPEEGRKFAIERGIDIVISHGPPKGILDRTAGGERAGCPDLFAAVARARPRIHCFGHIHEAWGAKKVAWRSHVSEKPSHFTDIDNERSEVIETLASLRFSKSDRPEVMEEELHTRTRYAIDDSSVSEPGKYTLFVNASIQGADGTLTQRPWVVDLGLNIAQQSPI